MKNIILLGVFLILLVKLTNQAVTNPASPAIPDLCTWQLKRDEIISKLSPKGQEAIKKILNNMQTAIFGSVKPILKLISAEVSSTIAKQNTQDSANFNTFLNVLNFGIDMLPFSDSGLLIDLCGYETNTRMVFSTLKPETQSTTANIFSNIFNQIFPSVRRALVNQISNNMPQNEPLIKQLNTTESTNNLVELNKVIGLNLFKLN